MYGAAKAEVERRVLELLPDVLVVRTSAFFGPWDDSNFIASLFRALDSNAKFLAPADSTVSPTYVPDLVHASLDLLVETAQAWGPAARPLFSALSSRRGRLLRPWHDALDAYLQEAPHVRIATGTDGPAVR